MLAVIALPTLLPLVALLQLLFPGMLRDQARHYRCAVQVLLTQSTLIFLQWALVRWVFTGRSWWLSDQALWIALIGVALVGFVISSIRHLREPAETSFALRPPVSLEFWALGTMALVGLLWAAYSLWAGSSPWDQMAIITTSSLAALGHLVYRKLKTAHGSARGVITTEMVFTFCQVAVGAGLGLYLYRGVDNLQAAAAGSEWSTFRGNVARTGAADPADAGPQGPKLLWTFDPAEKKGRVHIHSSPTVVGDLMYVGGMHEVFSLAEGQLYCIAGKDTANGPKAGERIWQFNAGDSLKSVFSSPTIAGGKLYFGEGYHQDRDCRLFCLDARSGDKVLWSRQTTSHVESSPAVVAGRVYVGAGDDGLLCLDPPQGDATEPTLVWQIDKLHIDASPAVVARRVYAGSMVGDVYQEFCALAADADSGEIIWKTESPLPMPAAPAWHDGRVFFSLGGGKANAEADEAEGRVWCLDAESGRRQWEAKARGSVLGSPAVADGKVFFASRDHNCYAASEADGQLLWRSDVGGPVVASPIAARGRVIVVTTSGVVSSLDAATGQALWKYDGFKTDGDDVFASPTLVGGRLYVACGGKVYCLGDVDSGAVSGP